MKYSRSKSKHYELFKPIYEEFHANKLRYQKQNYEALNKRLRELLDRDWNEAKNDARSIWQNFVKDLMVRLTNFQHLALANGYRSAALRRYRFVALKLNRKQWRSAFSAPAVCLH